jgi:hypothetical protein
MSVENDTIEIYNVGTEVSLTEKINAKIVTIAIHAHSYATELFAWIAIVTIFALIFSVRDTSVPTLYISMVSFSTDIIIFLFI